MENFRHQHEIFLERNKKTLVVSVGDSWTFGDSLGSIENDPEVDDYQARFTQLYGRLVADEIGADWLNYGVCGGNNLLALKFLSDTILGNHYRFLSQERYDLIKDVSWPLTINELLDGERKHSHIIKELKYHCRSERPDTYKIKKNYDNIVVLLTLTEAGRDSILHKKETVRNFSTVADYLKFEEFYIYQELKYIMDQSQAKFFVGRNFSVDFESTDNSLVDPRNIWIKLNFEENLKRNFDNGNINLQDILLSGPLSGIGIDALRGNFAHCSDLKQYLIDQIDRADKLWRWLRNNPMHHNRATCHPKKESHRLWADNILNQLL